MIGGHLVRTAVSLLSALALSVVLSGSADSAAQATPSCGGLVQVPAAKLDPSAYGPSFHGAKIISGIDTWAVGAVGDSVNDRTNALAEHWDGKAWSDVPTENPGQGTNVFNDVDGSSSSDVWAVGYEGPLIGVTPDYTLIEHWDGSSWQAVPSPNPSSVGINFLYGVAAVDAQ